MSARKHLRRLAVLRIEPINFAIREDMDKSTIIKRFQHFLNSIDFPIQIIISTNFLNLDNYIFDLELKVQNQAKETKNELLTQHFQSYKQHLLDTIQENSVLDRVFDIVIPETTNLDIQLGICMQQLKNLHLKARRLGDDEILKSLAGYFSDPFADNDRSMYASLITKDNYCHYMVAPHYIKNFPDHIQANKTYCKVIYAHGYPRHVEPGFLDRVIRLNGIFDISIFIEPIPIEDTIVNLNRELQKQKADLYAYELKSIINPALEIQYQDTRTVLELLQKGNDKLFNISLYINCKAQSKEQLELIARKVEAELNSILIIPKRANFRMKDGLKSTLPLADNRLGIRRNITTQGLSAFFPFTSQFLQLDKTGIWMGLNKNDVPLIKDIFQLSNPNGLILASSGSGKSYWTKLFIIRQLMNSTKVMVIDPQSEYVKLLKKFNGQIINFSRTSSTVINPLDLMGHDFAEKRLSLLDLFPIMLGELSEIQKAVLDKALTETYLRKGIKMEKNSTWNNEPPILGDLLTVLTEMSKKATIIEKETYRSLINRLSLYVDGVFSFFNRKTHIDFQSTFVGFIIGDMPKQAKPINMFLILDYVYTHMKKDLSRKLLVIDEAWSLLSRAEDSDYLFEIVKTCRKFNMGLLLITQDVADLLNSRASTAILQNSAYKLLMRQEPAVMETLTKTFKLSSAEQEKVLAASVGEGILLMENEHTEIRCIASKEEHDLITTNADELLKLSEEIEEEKEEKTTKEETTKSVTIKLDENKGYYRKADLSEEEFQYLLDKGYKMSWHQPLGGGKQELYLLKPTTRESLPHFFLVRAIAEYLQQLKTKVTLYETVNADIVFTAGKKKIAIEVETGVLSKDKKRLEEKIKLLNKNYDDWFFVVVSVRLARKYESLGKTYNRKNVCQIIRNYL